MSCSWPGTVLSYNYGSENNQSKCLIRNSVAVETSCYLWSGKTQNEAERHNPDSRFYDNASRLVKTGWGVWNLCKFSLFYQTYYCETRMNRVVTGNCTNNCIEFKKYSTICKQVLKYFSPTLSIKNVGLKSGKKKKPNPTSSLSCMFYPRITAWGLTSWTRSQKLRYYKLQAVGSTGPFARTDLTHGYIGNLKVSSWHL